MYSVKSVSRDDCSEFILNIHYAKRWPSISLAYGLYNGEELVGVVTYGTPPSPSLRSGVAGPSNKDHVIELNRLVLKDNLPNEASMLVGRSLSMIGKERDAIVVSFADISQDHIGYVYQATNFIYCGLSAKRTDWKLRGKEHLHGISVADEFRGQPNRSKLMREKYGTDFYLEDRPRKHRYVYLCGSRSFKKRIKSELRYQQMPYPKEST